MRSLLTLMIICCGVCLHSSQVTAQSLLEVDDVFGQSTTPLSEVITRLDVSSPQWEPGTIQQASAEYVPPAIAFDDSEKVEEATLEERLKALEEGWKKLDGAWEKFEAAEKKKKSDAAKKPTFQIGGRIHADYWNFVNQTPGIGFFEHDDIAKPNYGTDPEDRFAFRRVRLEMKGDILETMLWRIQVDFNDPQTPEYKDVYFGFKELPGNQTLLIGNQKRPLGLDALNSSRFNIFMERPFVVESFNSDARRPGVCMYGVTKDSSMFWQYGAFYLENLTTDGRVIGDNSQGSINGRLGGSPWYDESSGGRGYLHLAVAGMVAWPDGNPAPGATNKNEARFSTRAENRSDARWLDTGRIAGANMFETSGLEAILNYGAFQFVTEYQHTSLQRDTGTDLNFDGAYLYVNYFLTGEHLPYNRKSGTLDRLKPFENFFLVDNCCGGTSSGWGAWAIGVRYDYIDLTDNNIQGGIGEAVTGAVNWYWTAYSRVQFNCSYGQITDHVNVGGFTSGDYLTIGTRFAVDF